MSTKPTDNLITFVELRAITARKTGDINNPLTSASDIDNNWERTKIS